MTTADYLESLQDDLERINTALELEEGTNFTDIAQMAKDGDISTGGGGGVDLNDYFIASPTLSDFTSINNCEIFGIMKKIPSNITAITGRYGLAGCKLITEVPQITVLGTDMRYFCSGCTNLVTVPVLNTANIRTSVQNAFLNCPNLSNDSLNNIMRMCINSGMGSYKTLARLGLTQAQATTCTNLSNYEDFTSAGWSTGY